MNLSGSLKTTLTEKGAGHVMETVIDCQKDGQPFCRGEVKLEWADTNKGNDGDPFTARIKAVAEELNGEIECYDDLCLAQAKVADGLDDLCHLGQLFAAAGGIEIPKTEAFLDAVSAEDRAERAELRANRRAECQ